MAYETVTLFGVPIVSGRRVGYGKINPVEAREIFLRSALVEGLWRTRHAFFAQNAATRAEAEELQERTRRRDLVVDDQVIFDFYDARIPAEVTSGGHFDAWWKKTRVEQPDLLTLTLDDLIVPDRDGRRPRRLPRRCGVRARTASGSATASSPGAPRDGVSVTVPFAVLNQLDPAPFSWQVPGLRARTRHRTDPLTAQGGAPAVRTGSGVRRPGPGLAGGPSRTASASPFRRPWAGPCAALTGEIVDGRRLERRRRCRRICG